MADENAKVDANFKPVATAVTDDSNQFIKMLRIDDATKGLKVSIVGGGGSGTVTSISQGTGILLSTNPIVATGSVSLATSLQPAVTLAGNALKFLRVNAGETAVEYATVSSGLTVGTTTIASGTTTRILYDNAGVLGEYTISGSGTVVAMATSPVFTTPTLGVATATSVNGLTITSSTGVLTLTNLKTLAVTNTLTLSGTDSTVMTFPTTSATIARTDAGQTFTGVQVMTSPSITTSLVTGSSSFDLLTATATTINFASASTTLNIGASATCILNFGGSTSAAEFRFLEPSGSGTNYTAFKAQAQGANITYTLPATVGAANTVLTDVAGNGTLSWATPSGSTALTIVPKPNAPYGGTTFTSNSVSTNTTLLVGQVVVPFSITVNKISFQVASVSVAGTYDLTVYSEDGQTQKIAVTTASISASGISTTAVSAVVLAAGVYYFAINSNSTANMTTYFYDNLNNETVIIGDVTSEPVLCGTLTITAGTPPATITPTSITKTVGMTPIFRLDN